MIKKTSLGKVTIGVGSKIQINQEFKFFIYRHSSEKVNEYIIKKGTTGTVKAMESLEYGSIISYCAVVEFDTFKHTDISLSIGMLSPVGIQKKMCNFNNAFVRKKNE